MIVIVMIVMIVIVTVTMIIDVCYKKYIYCTNTRHINILEIYPDFYWNLQGIYSEFTRNLLGIYLEFSDLSQNSEIPP